MTKPFDKKIALVFGGTSGIGKATALAYANEGATVIVSGRREKEGTAVVEQIATQGGKAHFIAADVTKEEDVKNVLAQIEKKFSQLDFAFNNAGIEGDVGVQTHDYTVEQYRKVIDTNVLGVLLGMKYEIPLMLKNGGGSIINTASVLGSIAMPGTGAYTASKHAVIGLSRVAALEYGKKGIRINTVSPAAIETEMLDRFALTGGDREEGLAHIGALHPIGRIGKSEEIAAAVLFLSSPHASFMTGADLRVDGGFTAQ